MAGMDDFLKAIRPLSSVDDATWAQVEAHVVKHGFTGAAGSIVRAAVEKGSRTEAARYAASVRWGSGGGGDDKVITGGEGKGPMNQVEGKAETAARKVDDYRAELQEDDSPAAVKTSNETAVVARALGRLTAVFQDRDRPVVSRADVKAGLRELRMSLDAVSDSGARKAMQDAVKPVLDLESALA